MVKFIPGISRRTLNKRYPEAKIVVKVDGGYMIFDTEYEFYTWQNQK